MTTNNPNDSVNHIPLLSEEMERTLRRLAWKDETFREALIADPKGVIQQVFPHCFSYGKLPDDLTIKVIEEDPFTHHIVLPPLADQFATPTTNNASDFISQFPPLREEVERALRLRACKDETFPQELIADPKAAVERLFPQYFPDGAPKPTIKVIEQDPPTHHIVLPALPDQFLTFEIPEEEQLELIANMGGGFDRVRGYRLEGKSSGRNGCTAETYRICPDGQPQNKQERSDSNLKKRSRDSTRPPYDSKTQEGSKPESEYSYGQDNKKRRTDIKNQSS